MCSCLNLQITGSIHWHRVYYSTVTATENLVSAFGISQMVGGLFITAPMAALPESFAAWSVTRSGQVTSATTAVISDKAITLTMAFLPLALVGMPISDFQIFWVTLAFVAIVPAVYAAFIGEAANPGSSSGR